MFDVYFGLFLGLVKKFSLLKEVVVGVFWFGLFILVKFLDVFVVNKVIKLFFGFLVKGLGYFFSFLFFKKILLVLVGFFIFKNFEDKSF